MKENKEVLLEIFKALIKANKTGVINDTIWSYSCPFETLWDYIMSELDMSEEEYEKLEKEIE